MGKGGVAPMRVLHVVTELNIGGIQSFLLNLYKAVDKEHIQFDFLLSTKEHGSLEAIFKEMGSLIYRVTPRNESVIRNRRELRQFFDSHTEYDCVHFHMSNPSYIEPLECAYKSGVRKRIVHSHSTSAPKGAIHGLLCKINRPKIKRYATDFYACSDLAARWLFGEKINNDKVRMINNGVDLSELMFSPLVRKQARDELGLADSIVIGHVGRMCEPKNQSFLLEVFSEVVARESNCVLCLIGDGPDMADVKRKAADLGLNNNVLFLGMRNDVPRLIQAFDCFVMPSKWEGFPVTLLEVQAVGLPCVASDTITSQAIINANVVYLPLGEGAGCWAEEVLRLTSESGRVSNGCDNLLKAGFDINSVARLICNEYLRK